MHVADEKQNATPSTSERDVLMTQHTRLHATDVHLTSTLLCEHFAGCAKGIFESSNSRFLNELT
eukprot:COSAG06_NODE_4539_length_4164_cov_997.612792_2_plen_64_part_00